MQDQNTVSAKRETQVTAQINALHEAICFLEENIAKLDSVLIQITRQEIPEVETKNDEQPTLVSLAEELYNKKGRITNVNIQITSLINRLEL